MVRSGIQTGTDTWTAQVLRGPNGFDYGFIVAQYESDTAAQSGVHRLIEESTTTPAYVRTGSYLFFVDGAGSNDNIQRLLAMTPTLSRACVQNGIIFPSAGSPTTTTQGNNTSTCATPSTDDLESLLPDLGGEFSADRLVRTGIDTGTDSWIGQVLTGPEGFQYAYVVAKYESESAAEEGATRLVETATTTPAYVVTGQYVFFVDGAGSNDNIQRLLALTPALSSECVDDTVVFPNSPALGLAGVVGSHWR